MDRIVETSVNEGNCTVKGGNKNEMETMMKGPLVANVQWKRLADISNLPQQNQDAKAKAVSLNHKEHIDKLLQENMALLKLLAERNKIIELSAIELQKLRINFQKVLQQNRQLASANSQMLVEINSDKDRLKAFQHELGCKNGILIAMKSKSEKKASNTNDRNYNTKVELMENEGNEEICQAEKGDKKPCNSKRRRQSILEAFDTAIKPVHKEEFAREKFASARPCTRRQSTRFRSSELVTEEGKSEIDDMSDATILKSVPDEVSKKRRQSARLNKYHEQEATRDSLATNIAEFSVSIPDNDPIPETSVVVITSGKHDVEPTTSTCGFKSQESRRLSMRPKRQAAEKVQSYKEIPINVKMCRNG